MSRPQDARAYRIRAGRSGDAAACAEIEAAGSAMFAASRYPEVVGLPPEPPSGYARLAAAGRLLVAEPPESGAVVALAVLALDGADAHLCEIDVLPEHQGFGLGARLLDACADWGRFRGALRLTLTTFRDVPWNEPYYARRGFAVIAPEDGGEVLVRELAAAARRGWSLAERVAMARPIGSALDSDGAPV